MTKCSRSDNYRSMGTEGWNEQGSLAVKGAHITQQAALGTGPCLTCLWGPQRTSGKRGTQLGTDSSKVTLPLASEQHEAHLRAPCGMAGAGGVMRPVGCGLSVQRAQPGAGGYKLLRRQGLEAALKRCADRRGRHRPSEQQPSQRFRLFARLAKTAV